MHPRDCQRSDGTGVYTPPARAGKEGGHPMRETCETCFERLETLSNDELDLSAVALVRAKTRNAPALIAHLAEISRRKAALERGYPSLFEYCVRRLGLSEGCTALRIQVSNVARRFPQILAALGD